MPVEPTRIELDFAAVITSYPNVELLNSKRLESVIGTLFESGEVINLHIIAEATGETRGFCKWKDPTYHGLCGNVLSTAGVCEHQDHHDRKDAEYAATHQPVETLQVGTETD